jgi:hypothetical protein
MRERTRSESILPMSGTFFWYTGPSRNESPAFKGKSVCIDRSPGFGSVNPLHSKQLRVSHSRENIEVLPAPAFGRYRGEVGISPGSLSASYPISVQSAHGWAARGWSAAMSTSVTPLGQHFAEATEGLAYTAPKPGDQLSKRVAAAWFYINFGLLPTTSAFVEIVGYDERVSKETRRILKSKKSHIEVELLNDSISSEWNSSSMIWPYLGSWGNGVRSSETIVNEVKTDRIWFSCIRKLAIPTYITKGERFAYVTARVRGVNPVSLAYELTPNSWLVDYFVPLGPIINTIVKGQLWSIENPCLMHETRSRKRYTGRLEYIDSGSYPAVANVSASVTATVKRRYPYIRPLPAFIVPSLSPPQLANIASLIAARG